MAENPEIFLEVLMKLNDQLVSDLAKYSPEIEAKLIQNKLLSKYQAAALSSQKNLKSKTEYLLKDCIQFQLKKKESSHFKVLMDFLRTANDNDHEQVLISLYDKINKYVEDKTVPIIQSYQASDQSESDQTEISKHVILSV